MEVKGLVSKILPIGLQQQLKGVISRWRLTHLRRKAKNAKPGALVTFLEYTIRINDGPNFYILYKDIFLKRIYHFFATRPDPLILDCGSNIGMSILYFKHVYPNSRIIGFEPDPIVFKYLQENMERNKISDVKLVQAALSARSGKLTFYSDGKYASYLEECGPEPPPPGWQKIEVPCVRLRDYLTEEVDFLKMNIEGAEWEVLFDTGPLLRKVKEMVIEYHHLPQLPRTLHKILALLHDNGFEYLINDFDSETNPGVLPPFRLTPSSRYFLLVYAKRIK